VLEYDQVVTVHDIAFTDFEAIPNTGDSADVVALPNGGSAYVYVDFTTPSETVGFITSVDLDTFERTRLINLFDDANTSVIISGTATDAPGWVVISTHSCKVDEDEEQPWTCHKVMVAEIGGQGRVALLAHTYGCETSDASWFATPNANASTDLSRIFFTSDSGECTDGGEVFEITVPDELRDLAVER